MLFSSKVLILFAIFKQLIAVKIELRVESSDVPYLLFKRDPYSSQLVQLGSTKVFGPFDDITDQVSFLASGFEGDSGSRELPRMMITLHGINGKWKAMHLRYSNGIEAILFYRKQCPRNFYGAGCNIFCEPQDDSLHGHYDCDENGEKICMEGYTPKQCKESSYPWKSLPLHKMDPSSLDIRFIIIIAIFLVGLGLLVAVTVKVFRPVLKKLLTRKKVNPDNSDYSYPIFIKSQNSSGLYTSINYADMNRSNFPKCSLLDYTNNTTKTWKSKMNNESGTYIYV